MKTTRNNILYYASTALIIETAISLGFALLVSLFGGILASWINRGNDVSGYFLGVLGFSIFFSPCWRLCSVLPISMQASPDEKMRIIRNRAAGYLFSASSCSSYPPFPF